MRDHVGEVFNRWTVIEFDRREGTDYYWRAKCACGEVRSVDINSLKRGKSKSCGCYKLDMIPDMADITGHQFGKWTVVGFDRRDKEGGDRYYWWVECSCKDKTRKSVRLDILKAGKSQSCGCHKLEMSALQPAKNWAAKQDDVIGQKFGELTVLEFYESKGDHWYYLCRCDCGKESITMLSNMKKGHTKSCGHTRDREYGEAAKNKIKDGYIRSAQDRGYEWKLTDEEFDRLTSENCHYCGRQPSNVSKSKKSNNGTFVYSGIDRMDNTKGYISNNVVSCCKKCNMAKRNMPYEEFMVWIKDITLFNISKFLVEEV